MSTLIFLNSVRDYLKREGEPPSKKPIYICLNRTVFEGVKKKNPQAECYHYEEFIHPVDAQDQFKTIFKLTETWYRDGNNDISVFNGISIGRLLEQRVTYELFADTFRRITSLTEIVKKYRPTEIYYHNQQGDCNIELLAILQEKWNFKLYLENDDIRFDPVGYIFGKKWEFEYRANFRHLNLMIRLLSKLFAPFRFLKRKDRIRLFIYVNTPSVLDVYLSDREIQEKIQLIFPAFSPPKGIRNLLRLLFSGAEALPFMFNSSPDDRQAIREIKHSLQRLFGSEDWKRKFTYEGVNYAPFFKKVLSSLMDRKLETIPLKYHGYKKALEGSRLDFLVTKHDWEEDWQLIVEIAKSLGIETYTVMHAIPEYIQLSENQNADYLIVTGPKIKENYIKYGLDPERIIVIGSFIFDSYLPVIKDFSKTGNVLVLQHGSRTGQFNTRDNVDEQYIVGVKKVLDRLGHKNVIFRPRPAKLWYNHCKNILNKHGIDWMVFPQKNLKELVLQSDFVIGSVSTSLFESLILGRNYYFISLVPVYPLPPYTKEYLKMASSFEELEQMVKNRVEQPREQLLREFCNITGDEEYGHFSRKLYEFFIDRYEKKKDLEGKIGL